MKKRERTHAGRRLPGQFGEILRECDEKTFPNKNLAHLRENRCCGLHYRPRILTFPGGARGQVRIHALRFDSG